jgi:Mlo family
MLLGFISLLLTVFQGAIQQICIPPGWANHMLPCKREESLAKGAEATKEHLSSQFFVGVLSHGGRKLLSSGEFGVEHCQKKVFFFCLFLLVEPISSYIQIEYCIVGANWINPKNTFFTKHFTPN